MKKRSLYLLLVPFTLWVLNEIFIFKPEFFFIALSFGLLIIVLSVRSLAKKNGSKIWLAYALTPALFYLSFSFYSALIVSFFWIQIIFLLNAWFLFYYLRNIYYYFSFGAPEREAKLHRLLLSGSFLSAFAVTATLYGLPIFISWPFAILLAIFAAISFCLFGQFLIFTKGDRHERGTFLFISSLILTELVGVIFLLPLNYNILGLLAAIFFYFLLMMNNWRTENRLFWKNIKWPVFIGALITILILLTARWL